MKEGSREEVGGIEGGGSREGGGGGGGVSMTSIVST